MFTYSAETADLFPDLAVVVAALSQGADFAHEIDGLVLAAGTVLDEAHDQAVAFIGIDDDGGNFALAELDEGLEATLTADEIILDGVSYRDAC